MTDADVADGEVGAQVLTFGVGEETFGLDIRCVREIIQCRPMTSLPRVPAFVRGVINLRGTVMPVVDLHARFGTGAASLGKRSCIVIYDAMRDCERIELGLLVDVVSEVIAIPGGDIKPPPVFGMAVRGDFIRGIAMSGSRFIILLEPRHALDIVEMADLCERAQQAPMA